jgi:hypothetical protein
VIAKTNLPQLLEQELAVLARSSRLAEATIFMSSATRTRESSSALVSPDAERRSGSRSATFAAYPHLRGDALRCSI